MLESVITFLTIVLFLSVVGFCLMAFIKGRFPAIGNGMGVGPNRVMWGDKNVDPKLLIGFRARYLSLLLLILFLLFSLALFNQNNLIFSNILYSNFMAVTLGILIGIITYYKHLSYIE